MGYAQHLQSLSYNGQMVDVAEATLVVHSNYSTGMDTKREESKEIKAIHVLTEWNSQESDTDDVDNDHGELETANYESELCIALSQIQPFAKTEPSSDEESGSALPGVRYETNSDHDCTLLQNDTAFEDLESDSSSNSSDTLDLSSDDEGEPNQHVSIDRGGGDASFNLNPRHQIIKVKIASKQRVPDPEAYKKWLKAKNDEIRRNRDKEMLTKQELQRQKELDETKRKEMSKKKIQEWMIRKKQEINGKKSSPNSENNKSHDISSEHLYCDPDAKYKNWLQKVRKREEEKRLRNLTVKQLEQQIQQEKKKISKEVYQQWLKSAKHKPKPVPLNQGPNTLRGTVSKIFVNPEPWKNNSD
ncbi:coiled-coil domain-containing protein 34-like [Anopheles moucheti]|uniref:coiled-coil domain-containing protein 34-like n=1 Tax=Anopheles moucheti TaxID=186751 RepID=UPI0022EFE52B|nr:coiled-coil domain-containing protein 34-like [Anopheles moucheti]